MRVLVACEYSGRVREAFRKRGHYVRSIDLLESEDNSPWHIVGDVMGFLEGEPVMSAGGVTGHLPWDLIIAHPPCTDLAVSGARHFPAKIADGRQQKALDFVKAIMDAPCDRIAIENPVSVISTKIRAPDQYIQPYEYGHGETKKTCLWIKGLSKLKPTNEVSGRSDRIHKMPPGPNRWKERSRTYQGIADAMAEQWG